MSPSRHLFREEHGADAPPVLDPEARAHVLQRIAILRAALEDLEVELAVGDKEPEPARSLAGEPSTRTAEILYSGVPISGSPTSCVSQFTLAPSKWSAIQTSPG